MTTAKGRKETKDVEVDKEEGEKRKGEGTREQVCWLTPAHNLLHHVHLRRSPEGLFGGREGEGRGVQRCTPSTQRQEIWPEKVC